VPTKDSLVVGVVVVVVVTVVVVVEGEVVLLWLHAASNAIRTASTAVIGRFMISKPQHAGRIAMLFYVDGIHRESAGFDVTDFSPTLPPLARASSAVGRNLRDSDGCLLELMIHG
jgi:hypothetical protein